MKNTPAEDWFVRFGNKREQCLFWEISAATSEDVLDNIEDLVDCYPNEEEVTGCREYLVSLREYQKKRWEEKRRRR